MINMLSKEQVVIIIFITIVMILAIWNLVLSIQNMKINKKKNDEDEKKDYYGRLK